LKYVKTGRPFVVLKNAVSLDGKLATKTGESRWLSGEESRQIVHQLRDQLDAILVGLGTVIADNPRLTARTPDGGSDPIRIILDSNLSVPLESKVLNLKSSAPTIIAAAAGKGMEEKREKLEERGVELIRTEGKRVELNQLLQVLGDREITSLLVEGGSRVNTSFWEEKLVDKLYYFIAPKILGGGNAPPAVAGKGVDNVGQAINIVEKEVSRVGEDILIIGYPNYAADRKG
ncbi:MAG: bifunctional diaminohydroxyphosphoribosylaminopyrimidine deaminase/5-amino-6-(5-phosphoribosylamino)uracil reductase RibD, partial [Candidatus Bipolaricaulota bacterium]